MKSIVSFPDFFRALWPGRDPFPWQTMLAERGLAGEWPEAISLPTASGKTACLDAALYSLAMQADLPLAERTAPRRIWFVVDRRIVVDEAHARALKLSKKLTNAKSGILRTVADRLRSLSGTDRPLAVAKLRGGSRRDDTWAFDPAQPAVICSTVDQVGSSLLFRSYGHGDLTASIWAGLVAHDSLILLDEAHCAVPFLQTLRAVARFRGDGWAEQPLRTPFATTIFSATLPEEAAREIPAQRRFPRNDAERMVALDHDLLLQRMRAAKPTNLVVAPKPQKDEDERAPLAAKIAEIASGCLKPQNGKRRIAIMVNRVATAETVALSLRKTCAQGDGRLADVVLLTGRMRPLDRDALVADWSGKLAADSTEELERPVVLVTTQCLEVGADFSFDALVTECASLDALRQRFGRLNRLGKPVPSSASIVVCESDTKEPESEAEDPIYGRAIFETWQWLWSLTPGATDPRLVDFGISAMDGHIAVLRQSGDGADRFSAMLAPAPDAPVLLPSHLDLLCQTAPRPDPEPEVAFFLHGKKRAAPEVRVLWRADLPDLNDKSRYEEALDILSLLPPASPEMLSVPLYRLKRWLEVRQSDLDKGEALDEGDVEGRREPDTSTQRKPATQSQRHTPFIIWRGRDESCVKPDPAALRPGDTVVLLASAGMSGLGQSLPDADARGLGVGRIDLAEEGALASRPRPVLRLRTELWNEWPVSPALTALLETAQSENFDRAAFMETWREFRAEAQSAVVSGTFVGPPWLWEVIDAIGDKPRIERMPGDTGLLLLGRFSTEIEDADPYADRDDSRSGAAENEISLTQHSADVQESVRRFATRCLPDPLCTAPNTAAPIHDFGKIDHRFQVLLHGGDEAAVSDVRPLAKSPVLAVRPRKRALADAESVLPDRFRHEMVSLQLAEHFGLVGADAEPAELALHLIASHHGHARPFAPVVEDPAPPEIDLSALGMPVRLSRAERTALPPSRLDSGVADRFWSLTRRHGWWGLAYIEAVFRLGDWHASRHPECAKEDNFRPRLSHVRRPASRERHELVLTAIDGANPLGFLAALGTLRVISVVHPELHSTLSWIPSSGSLAPLLNTTKTISKDELPELLSTRLGRECVFPTAITGNPEWQKLRISESALREHMIESSADTTQISCDFWATFFSETASRDGIALKTRFDFHSGQQKIVESISALRRFASPSALRQTLFDGWQYLPRPSLRWDPLDEKRQYALQANDPAYKPKNPILTDVGANLLALEALVFFPMVPDQYGSQGGFDRARYAREWTWPLWRCELTVKTAFSVLHMPLDENAHRRAGDLVWFRSRMAESGKGYRSFSPSRSV